MTNVEVEKKFEENKKLIYLVIRLYIDTTSLNNLTSEDDLFQIGSLALVNAINTYKQEKGAFSTYATKLIKNKIYNAIRDYSEQTLDNAYSLNAEETEFLEEQYVLRYNNTKTVEEEIFIKEQKEILKEIAKKYTGISQKGVIAIQLITEGYSYKKIAEVLKTDDKTLTAWVSRARSKLKNEPAILKLLGREII